MRPILSIVLILVLLSVGALYFHFNEPLGTYASPDGIYRLEIFQQRYPVLLNERYVYVNVDHGGAPAVRHKLLYTGDFLDDDFRALYPRVAWRTPSIIEIGQEASGHASRLTVANETDKVIRYLLIETIREKLLLLNVAPRAAMELDWKRIGRLSCQGAYVDGERFGVAVTTTGPEVVGAHFSILVNSDGAKIQSPDLHLLPTKCCAVDRPDFYHE